MLYEKHGEWVCTYYFLGQTLVPKEFIKHGALGWVGKLIWTNEICGLWTFDNWSVMQKYNCIFIYF